MENITARSFLLKVRKSLVLKAFADRVPLRPQKPTLNIYEKVVVVRILRFQTGKLPRCHPLRLRILDHLLMKILIGIATLQPFHYT